HAVGGGGERRLEAVAPGRDDGGDLGFQRRVLDDGRFALIAPDNVVDACERSLGEGGVGGRQAPLIDLHQEVRDAHAYVGVVFLARNEDEDGDETVELVGPCQRPYAGTLIERQDLHDEIVERFGIDLEE